MTTNETINGRFILSPAGSAWLYARIEDGKVVAMAEEATVETHAAAGDGLAWLADLDQYAREDVSGDDAAAIVREVMGEDTDDRMVGVERIAK